MLIILSGCKSFQSAQPIEGEEPVARVFDKYLYKSEVESYRFEFNTKEDSSRFVKGFIDGWIKDQLLYEKAIKNLPENNEEINKQVEEYRSSLIRFLYEKEMLAQNLEAEIKNEAIQNYYETYKENFKLSQNVIRPRYIVIDKKHEKVDSIKKWILSEDPDEVENFNNFAIQYSDNYANGKTWFVLEDFNKNLPFELAEPQVLLNDNKYMEWKQKDFIYMLFVDEYGKKDSIAPLDYKKQDIEKIIVNKRKTDYLKKMKERIYNDALNKQEFEIYESK